MRRIKLRQRGFRPQGTAYTGENVNKKDAPVIEQPEKAPVKKVARKAKKETVTSKVKKAVKKLTKKK